MSYHLDDNPLDKIFRRAVSRSCAEWGWDESQYADDLVQDLWVWFLESPRVQTQFADLMGSGETALVRELCFKAAGQLMSKEAISSDVFQGRVLYSIDSVKDALKSRSTNKHLLDLIPLGLQLLHNQDDESEDRGNYRGYAEAIRLRYVDRVIPVGNEADRLTKAHRALTIEVNNLNLTFAEGTVGSVNVVFADLRKQKGKHGDPTGDTALALIAYGDDPIEFVDDDQNPISLVDETGIPQATTTYRQEFLDVQHFRSAFQRHARVRDVPRSGRPRAVAAPEADVG